MITGLWLAVASPAFSPVLGSPATSAVIAETAAALDAGNAAEARRLADAGLAETDITGWERSRLLMDRGAARELLGNPTSALADFSAALETRNLPAAERAQALLQRGFLLDGLGCLDDAARDYGAAVALKTPVMATALNNRANILRRQNRLGDAQRDYRAALAAGTARPQFPYYGLGQISETQHDPTAARGFYASALMADPGYGLAQARLDALGGPPEGALAEPDKITLRPPMARKADTSRPVAPTRVFVPARKATPRRGEAPGLRPALDGSRIAVSAQVQLGAWRSEAEARSAWETARMKTGGLLNGLSPTVAAADLAKKGVYYRLRVKTPDPSELCRRLQGVQQPCFPVHN